MDDANIVRLNRSENSLFCRSFSEKPATFAHPQQDIPIILLRLSTDVGRCHQRSQDRHSQDRSAYAKATADKHREDRHRNNDRRKRGPLNAQRRMQKGGLTKSTKTPSVALRFPWLAPRKFP